MSKLSPQKKDEIRSRIASFSFSGFKSKLASDICRYHTGSLVGQDFKIVAQIAPFILLPYVEDKEKPIWLDLSKVHCTEKLPFYSYITLHFFRFSTYQEVG